LPHQTHCTYGYTSQNPTAWILFVMMMMMKWCHCESVLHFSKILLALLSEKG